MSWSRAEALEPDCLRLSSYSTNHYVTLHTMPDLSGLQFLPGNWEVSTVPASLGFVRIKPVNTYKHLELYLTYT